MAGPQFEGGLPSLWGGITGSGMQKNSPASTSFVTETPTLTKSQAEINAEAAQAVAHLARERERVHEELVELRKNVDQKEEEVREEARAEIRDKENEVTALRAVIQQRDKAVRDLKEQLDELHEFRDHRQQFHAQLQDGKMALAHAKQKHKDSIANLEMKYFDQKLKLQKEFAIKVNGLHEASDLAAAERLDEATKRVFADNEEMSRDLRKQIDLVSVLRNQLGDAVRDRKEAEMERKNAFEMQQEAISQLAVVKRKLARMEERAEAAEDTLEARDAELAEARERAAAAVGMVEATQVGGSGRQGRRLPADPGERGLESVVEDLQLDIDALKELLAMRSEDLRKVRRLGRAMLDQRTELEQFFLAALRDVKREVQVERAKDSESMVGALTPLPNRTADSLGSELEKDSLASAVSGPDISTFSWAERERVLRMLFFKMNHPEQVFNPPPKVTKL